MTSLTIGTQHTNTLNKGSTERTLKVPPRNNNHTERVKYNYHNVLDAPQKEEEGEDEEDEATHTQ